MEKLKQEQLMTKELKNYFHFSSSVYILIFLENVTASFRWYGSEETIVREFCP